MYKLLTRLNYVKEFVSKNQGIYSTMSGAGLPNDIFAARETIKHWGAIIFLTISAPYLIDISKSFIFLIALCLGVSTYKLTILMHECVHNTFFKSYRINYLIGSATGWMLGTSFIKFRKAHFNHHELYGMLGDPQGNDYLNLQNACKTKLIWHLIKPLTGLNLVKIFQVTPAVAPATVSSGVAENRLLLYFGIMITQLVIALLTTGFLTHPELVLLYPVSAATFGLFFSQLRGFAEHVPPPEKNGERFVRSHKENLFDKLFFYSINFNYHAEHHLFPSIPAHQLPQVRQQLIDSSYSIVESTSILKTIFVRICESRSWL